MSPGPHRLLVVAATAVAAQRLEADLVACGHAVPAGPLAGLLDVVRLLRADPAAPAVVVCVPPGDDAAVLALLEAGAHEHVAPDEVAGQVGQAVLRALRRRRAELAAGRRLSVAHGLLDAVDAPTCAVDRDAWIVAVNDAWTAFAAANGGRDRSTGPGSNYLAARDPVATTDPGSRDAAHVARGIRQVLDGTAVRFEHEYSCRGPSDQRWFSVRVSPARVDGPPGAVISHVDVTARHEVQQALSHQAMHDALTGLPNRLLLVDRLAHGLAACSRRDTRLGVAFLDLDHFKRVNDGFGHAAGDVLLQEVASHLRARLRDGDTLSRLAIDDFGTGYSSLLYLRRHPIDTLKVDRAFVAGLETSADDAAICSSVVDLARARRRDVDRRGVETSGQYATLRDMHCQLAQGFLWSPADLQVRTRVRDLHHAEASLHTIAAALSREAAEHPDGLRWTAAAVARVLTAA